MRREAIVNCYCHRDWTLSGDIKIEFYDDRVQIFSPGSLPDGLTLENIKMGMVAKRNKIIVDTLDKADVIENYTSGVRRIFEDYAHSRSIITANLLIVGFWSLNRSAALLYLLSLSMRDRAYLSKSIPFSLNLFSI